MMFLGRHRHAGEGLSDILQTPTGSRVMRRDYGSTLFALIDQPQTPALKLQIMAAIYGALLRWEDRLTLSQLALSTEAGGKMTVDLVGQRTDTAAPFTLTLPYKRITVATIDLSQLHAPNVIASLDFETLFAQRKDSLIALYPPEQREALRRTLRYESEPLVKLLQENTYRELLLRQRINEASQANMLGYATGTDLDHLGANYNVQRLIITPADDTQLPPTPAVKESDRDFRLRIQQAFEGLSVAGPSGAYQFHGRSADGRVADIVKRHYFDNSQLCFFATYQGIFCNHF